MCFDFIDLLALFGVYAGIIFVLWSFSNRFTCAVLSSKKDDWTRWWAWSFPTMSRHFLQALQVVAVAKASHRILFAT